MVVDALDALLERHKDKRRENMAIYLVNDAGAEGPGTSRMASGWTFKAYGYTVHVCLRLPCNRSTVGSFASAENHRGSSKPERSHMHE